MRRVAIYARVSTEEQARVEEGSIKNQVAILERYVQAENLKNDRWGVVVAIYKDEGYSAKDLNRPEIRRLLIDVNKGKIDTVLITEISRLSRSVKDWISLREFFNGKDAAFIASRQNFDTSNAMGRAMLSFAIEFSQLEREMTAERVKASCHARASRGLWTGGYLPYGLERTDKNGHLRVAAAQQVIAVELVDILLTSAGSATKAVEEITALGYARADGKPWDDKTFATWIRQRELIGEVEVNAKNKDKVQDKLSEAEKYKIIDAVWEAVLPKDKWEQANRLLDENYRDLKIGNWKYYDYLLTRILTCAKGKPLVGSSGWGQTGEKYTHYRHSPKDKNCGCGIKTVPAAKIEKVVFAELKAIIKTPAFVKELATKANERFQGMFQDYTKEIFSARTRVNGIAKKIDRLTDQFLGDDAGSESDQEMWRNQLRRLHDQKRCSEAELKQLESAACQRTEGLIDAARLTEALERLITDFDSLPTAAKRNLISAILAKVEILGTEIVIHIKSPDLPLPKRGTGTEGVNLGGQPLAHEEGWLLRQDSNLRPGD